MKITYSDGTSRTVADDINIVSSCLDRDLSPGWVHYAGLVWDTAHAEDSENDDGIHAQAEIQNYDGSRNVDFLP